MNRRFSFRMLPAHILVWAYVVVLCVPLYVVIVSAFKDNIEIFSNGFALPSRWLWQNFSAAWEQAGLAPALLNSVFITAGAELCSLLIAVPAAYGIARSKGRI